MGLLPDTQNCLLRKRWECRERFARHRLQRKPLVNDPGMHHGTCVTHTPWCMSGTLTHGGGENVPGIPGACATRNFVYLVRGPLTCACSVPSHYLNQWWLIGPSGTNLNEILIKLWSCLCLHVYKISTILFRSQYVTNAWVGFWYCHKQIEAETRRSPFSRRHFQIDFLEWKCMNFD